MVLGVSCECQDVLTCRIFVCTEDEVSVVTERKYIVIPVAVGSSLVFILLSFSNKRHLQCPDVSILSILGHSLSHAPIPNTCLWILYRPSASEFTDDRHRCDFNWSSISDCPAWVTRLGCRFRCTFAQCECTVEVAICSIGECYNTSNAVLNDVFFALLASLFNFGSTSVSTACVEYVVVNIPDRSCTCLAVIEAYDNLIGLTAVNEDVVLKNVLVMVCTILFQVGEVLRVSNIHERRVLNIKCLEPVFVYILRTATILCKEACIHAICVDGRVVNNYFAYISLAVEVDDVLCSCRHFDNSIVNRQLLKQCLLSVSNQSTLQTSNLKIVNLNRTNQIVVRIGIVCLLSKCLASAQRDEITFQTRCVNDRCCRTSTLDKYASRSYDSFRSGVWSTNST